MNLSVRYKVIGAVACFLGFLLSTHSARAGREDTSLTTTINIYIGLADFNFLTNHGTDSYSYLIIRCPHPSTEFLAATDGSTKQYLDLSKTHLEKIASRSAIRGYALRLTYRTADLNSCNDKATRGRFQMEFYSDPTSVGGLVPGDYSYDPSGKASADYILGVQYLDSDITLPVVTDLIPGKFPREIPDNRDQ